VIDGKRLTGFWRNVVDFSELGILNLRVKKIKKGDAFPERFPFAFDRKRC
jgi:hypothetical protein